MRRLSGVLIVWLATISSWAADYARVGALAKDGNWEVSVIYTNTAQRSILQSSYLLPPDAELTEIRDQPLDNGVVLSMSGLATNSSYTITLTNISAIDGTGLPAVALSFRTKPTSWAAIGTQELGFPAEALAAEDDAFDLISGGSQMFDQYDESTFVYEKITGDFDKRVRIDSQEASSDSAQAGLMVREELDELRPRPIDSTDPAEAFSRYLQVQVNPANTDYTDFHGQPVPGLNRYQISFRSLPGGSTENPPAGTNAPPYPDAWLRLKRTGQTFYVFRASDGTNWVNLGVFKFPTTDVDLNPVAPFASTVFVGPNYAPQVSNIPISTGVQRAFLARFREYSDASGNVEVEAPVLSITRSASGLEIRWSAGTLEATSNIATDVWVNLGTVSPLQIIPQDHYQYFRARNP